jgi:hypothetical protein
LFKDKQSFLALLVDERPLFAGSALLKAPQLFSVQL